MGPKPMSAGTPSSGASGTKLAPDAPLLITLCIRDHTNMTFSLHLAYGQHGSGLEELCPRIRHQHRQSTYRQGIFLEQSRDRRRSLTPYLLELEQGESSPDTPANPRLCGVLTAAQALDTDLADLLAQTHPRSPISATDYLWLIRTVHKPSIPINPKPQTTQSECRQQEPPPPQIRLLEDQNTVSLIVTIRRQIRY